MKGTCSVCKCSVRLYREKDSWDNREVGPLLADSHRRGRQYLCPGSHVPSLPKRLPSARTLIIVGSIALLVIAVILIMSK